MIGVLLRVVLVLVVLRILSRTLAAFARALWPERFDGARSLDSAAPAVQSHGSGELTRRRDG